jgi:putative heme transporter
VFLYLAVPRLAGLEGTWHRIREGDPVWLVACVVFELLSFGGYVWLFRGMFVRGSSRIDWRSSYEITMAGLAATRLFAAAGAGGAALTAWALRRSGMSPRVVAVRMVAQYVILYGVYMGSLVIGGLLLRSGIAHGGTSFALTVLPAIIGGAVILVALAFTLIPTQLDAQFRRWSASGGGGRMGRVLAQVAKAPATVSGGVREALAITRERDGALAGAVIWWYCDILTLWAAFHAFGQPPPFVALVMSYFVGMLANLLPLPGGIGGVDGGMIGALIAFGVDEGLALVAVLTYRAFAFWLPTIPGFIAYFHLRRTVQRWREAGDGTSSELPSAAATIQTEVKTSSDEDDTWATSRT